MSKQENVVLMNFRLEEDLRKQFHIWCIQNDTTIAERLRVHIQSDLREVEEED